MFLGFKDKTKATILALLDGGKRKMEKKD